MTYNIYLREGSDCRFIEKVNAEQWWPPADRGETWSIVIDGREALCEIEEVGAFRLAPDGKTLLSQDVFVHRLQFSK